MRIIIFGAFDGLHDGHRALFGEAKKYGDELVVVLAQDSVIKKLKGHAPRFNYKEREEHLRREDGIAKVIEGDKELSSWAVLGKIDPDEIVLGYDQTALKDDLEKFMGQTGLSIPIHVASPFKPEKLHSSFLNK